MQETGSKGSMPHLEAPPEHNVKGFKCLTEVVEALWTTMQQVPQSDEPVHRNVLLFCQAGRHRSYALVIAFLLWSSYIHEPKLWQAIISPNSNSRLCKDCPCELATLQYLRRKQLSKGGMWPSVTA